MAFVALLGAGEGDVVTLAELHRNPRVHIVGVYDPHPLAVGHELAEILGIMHGHHPGFLDQIAAAGTVVIPREIHRFAREIELLRKAGCRLLTQAEALETFVTDRVVEHPVVAPDEDADPNAMSALEQSLYWLEVALERESFLRALLSVAVQAVGADKGSVQLFDPFTQQLYIAYAEGLSDHTVRSSRQCLGEGISGRVAETRRAELLRGQDLVVERRDRPDIESAISVPLVSDDDLLGVINVSTDEGAEALNERDLERLAHLGPRISNGLKRLLEVQSAFDHSLTFGIEQGLDRIIDEGRPTLEALAQARDLVTSASAATEVELILLGADGPSLHLLGQTGPDGEPVYRRDVNASQGILGQVLLDASPVVLEERNRRAGESRVRREMTLYLPLGGREAFMVLLMHFHSLGALSHFQRSMERVRDCMTPRLGTLLARHESRARHDRLRRLAAGLAQLASTSRTERLARAAALFMDLTGASAVAIWRGDNDTPDAELRHAGPGSEEFDPVWMRLRERLRRGRHLRLRELDPAGSDLRSLLLVGQDGGLAIAALNRRTDDPLSEAGFRDEDIESAELLLQSLSNALGDEEPETEVGTGVHATVEAPVGEEALKDAVERELARARRYHLGFSLSIFELELAEEALAAHLMALRQEIERSSRGTDALIWLEGSRVAILAPEEMRGQRALVRRFTTLIDEYLGSHLGGRSARVSVRTATYPRDGETAEEILGRCLGDPGSAS
jgi:hypothetical protein